jgi:hypothetical protein
MQKKGFGNKTKLNRKCEIQKREAIKHKTALICESLDPLVLLLLF